MIYYDGNIALNLAVIIRTSIKELSIITKEKKHIVSNLTNF